MGKCPYKRRTVMLNYIKSVWDAIVEYQEKRATLYALSRLSDKELADIGVPRHRIYEAVFFN